MRDPARPSYEFGPFRLGLSEHLLLRNGQPVPLTPKNFEVLSFVGETVTGAKILKVRVGGGAAQTVVTLPFDEIGSVSMTPDGRRFVCTVYSSSSDVWIVDDFDAPADTRMVMR